MINVPRARAQLAQAPGDVVAFPKAQIEQLLAEVEIGQRARFALVNLKTVTAVAANAIGVPA